MTRGHAWLTCCSGYEVFGMQEPDTAVVPRRDTTGSDTCTLIDISSRPVYQS